MALDKSSLVLDTGEVVEAITPVIISASRSTDIPAFYAKWFFNRLAKGYCVWKNPFNQHQRMYVSFDRCRAIVFWTKNPEPMMERLEELSPYPYYFQFTLTGYGKDIEPGVPHKKEKMIPVFQKLSEKIGKHRVIWRYDPVIFTGTYTPEYHLKAFEQIAGALNGYTDKCVISFGDVYAKNKKIWKSWELMRRISLS